jgi:hypothetical protein
MMFTLFGGNLKTVKMIIHLLAGMSGSRMYANRNYFIA